VPRAEIADDIKALDQDARGLLRKHGVRFGQFTIFLPLLLKPAPTRLRLVLWGLEKGLDRVPDSPPPGLVTIPHEPSAPEGYYTMSGYRPAASRAIRIDMLERLADMLRGQDTRGGFEATADMLSITGLTLEQFADLMGGLGYKADRGERPKVKTAPEPSRRRSPRRPTRRRPWTRRRLGDAPPTGLEGADTPDPTPQEVRLERRAKRRTAASGGARRHRPRHRRRRPRKCRATRPRDRGGVEPEIEVFYTFTWAPRRRGGDGVRSVVPRAAAASLAARSRRGGKPRAARAPGQGRQ
jgi:ATP-dependent RNA helicase SUPV3L1/SUV3